MTDTRQTLNLRIWEHETEIIELDRKIQALQDKRRLLTTLEEWGYKND